MTDSLTHQKRDHICADVLRWGMCARQHFTKECEHIVCEPYTVCLWHTPNQPGYSPEVAATK
jgi:hypothetical protein